MSVLDFIHEADSCRADMHDLAQQLSDIASRLRCLAEAAELPDDEEIDKLTTAGTLAKMASGLATMRRLRLLGVRVGSLVKTGTAQTPIAAYSETPDQDPPQVNDHGQTQLLFPLD